MSDEMPCYCVLLQNVIRMVGIALLLSFLHLAKPRLIAQASGVYVQNSSAGIATPATDEDVKEIIKLASAGFSDQLVIQQIKSEGKTLLFSADQRNLMMRDGIDGKVVLALSTLSASGSTLTPTNKSPQGSQAGCPTEVGAYYKTSGAWKPMEARQSAGFKTTGLMKGALTYGIASSRMKAQFRDARSPYQLKDAMLQVCLVGVASNGRDLTLVKFQEENDRREIQWAKLGTWSGPNYQIDPKRVIPVEVSKLAEKLYLVASVTPLPEGEFILLTTMPAIGITLDGYDFGNHPER
jgi:hypothetical protein